MFSTTPRIGTCTFRNISMPRFASSNATSCGVVTMIAPVTGTGLREAQLNIAGAGRHVDDEVVELAPQRVVQNLVEGADDHRTAPDHGLVFVDEEADRVHLDAVRGDRMHLVAADDLRTLAADAKHHGLAWAVNVRIETDRPSRLGGAAPNARFTAVVDLPTPPLPEATTTMWLTWRRLGLMLGWTRVVLMVGSVTTKQEGGREAPFLLREK